MKDKTGKFKSYSVLNVVNQLFKAVFADEFIEQWTIAEFKYVGELFILLKLLYTLNKRANVSLIDWFIFSK